MSRRGRAATGLAALTTLVALTLAGAGWLVPGLRQHAVLVASLAAVARNDVGVGDLDAAGSSTRTNYLVVGTDQRHVPAGGRRDIRSERADALMVWSVRDDGRALVLSLPRDLRVHVPGHGDGKLGGALDYGPAAVIDGVRSLTGLPVHHYVELEFSAFVAAVDRVGGLRVDLAARARDRGSALDLPAGTQTLRGTEALAFVRSRTHEQLVGGQWVRDHSGDLGRIERQHLLLSSLPDAVRRCGGLQCVGLLAGLGDAVTLDRTFTTGDLRTLAVAVAGRGARMSTTVLPTRPARQPGDSLSPFPPAHLGNVGYRQVDLAAARPVLDGLRAGPVVRGASAP
ncbi:LCP family protein [Intrasporangium sp.]|uniref:LCP family protein n=1 Tax=Intrasporangium sp. TaxID=1925024 RepID=UPI00293ACD3D|nr:LCP family protein [Intrasporangium sp.]MDV3222447.1 LCP family protein [Intrasporangium sp.]